MADAQQTPPDVNKCCYTCGDSGFSEVLATCSNCELGFHYYCMEYINGQVPREIPQGWTCEDCLSAPEEDTSDDIEKENLQHTSNTVHHHEVERRGSPTVSHYAGRRIHSVKTGKVKFLSTEEVMKLSSGAAIKGSPSKTNFGNRPGCSSVSLKFSPPRAKLNPKYLTFSPPKPPGLGRTPISSISSYLPPTTTKEQKASLIFTEEHSCKDTGSPAKKHSCRGTVGNRMENCFKEPKTPSVKPDKEVKFCNFNGLAREVKNCNAKVIAKEVKTRNINAEEDVNKSSTSAHHPPINRSDSCCSVLESQKSNSEARSLLTNLPKYSLYHPYLPASHVIWTGGFKFLDTATPGKFYGGFQAQLPSRVDRRAYEFAKNMPIYLQIELLPRNHVWTDLFQNDYPDFQDIALYFLPSKNIKGSHDNLASLFKLMEIQDSVLRNFINDVELLIFTSKQLHGYSQDIIERLGMEQFFWGVFHHEKRDQMPLEHDGASITCNDDINMEIDMIGGRPSGRLDIIVRKEPSTWACGELGNVKITAGEDTMRTSMDSIQQLQIESERAQQKLFSLFSEASLKKSSELVSMVPVQSSMEKLSVAKIEADLPPGFEVFFPFSAESQKIHCKLNSLLPLRSSVEKLSGAENQVEVPPGFEVFACSKASQEKNCESASIIPLQSSMEKSSDIKTGVDIPPGFEELSRMKFRNLSFEDKSEEPADLNDGRFKGLVEKATDLQKVRVDGMSQYFLKEVKTEAEKVAFDSQDLSKVACWSPPPANWVKLNVAGRSKGNTGITRGSGIIRDESGKWILGYTLNMDAETTLRAELWSIFEGLRHAWNEGFKKVLVECESPVAVQHLKESCSLVDPNRVLIECCKNLLNCEWCCEVVRVDEAANLSAKWLATRFEDHPTRTRIFKRPPDEQVPILQSDSMGIQSRQS